MRIVLIVISVLFIRCSFYAQDLYLSSNTQEFGRVNELTNEWETISKSNDTIIIVFERDNRVIKMKWTEEKSITYYIDEIVDSYRPNAFSCRVRTQNKLNIFITFYPPNYIQVLWKDQESDPLTRYLVYIDETWEH